MKNITGMYVQQTRLFAPDVVPYHFVITSLGSNLMRQALGFGSTNWQENLEFIFQDGTVEHQGQIVPITWASFHNRRILIRVLGNSGAAHAAYAAIREVLTELDPDFRNASPLASTEETSCAAELDFEWTALFNPSLVEHVSQRAQEFSSEQAARFIKGVTVRFAIGTEQARALSEAGISLYDQNLIIEPRTDTPLSERTYYTYSPCDSDTHLRLISALETNLSRKGRRGRSRRRLS